MAVTEPAAAEATPEIVEDLSLNSSFFDNTTHNITINDYWYGENIVYHIDFIVPSYEELEPYYYPDVSNSYCNNQASLQGSVTLERYNDNPLPEYDLNLTVAPTTSVPFRFDSVQVYFGSSVKDRRAFLGTAYSVITNATTGETSTVPSITVQPGESVSFMIDSANWLNTLLANSSTGNTFITVAFYDGPNLVGAFHTCPPAVYGRTNLATVQVVPIGIAVKETKPLLFEDYVTVGKKVDADFFANNPYYATQEEGASAALSESATEAAPDAEVAYTIMTDPNTVNLLSLSGPASYDSATGIYQLDLMLTNNNDEPIVFNQTQVIIENGQGNGSCITIPHVGVDSSGNTYPLTILPGKSEPLTLTSDQIDELASLSDRGQVAIHIASYDGVACEYDTMVSNYHAILVPISQLKDGAQIPVQFESYATVNNKVS